MMAPRPPEEPASPCMLNRADRRSEYRKFRNFFEEEARKRAENPLLYAHSTAMVGGWPKEVVDEVAMAIGGALLIPDEVYVAHTGFGPAPTIRRAVAAFLISGFYNEKVADCATHYPRKSSRYNDLPKRYRVKDPYNSHYYRTKAADILADHRVGLITHAMGEWGEHRESTYLLTGDAVALLSDLVDVYALSPALPSEVLQLRKRGDGPGYKRLLPYDDTPETIAKRERVQRLNKASAELVVYHGNGHRMPEVRYHQTFSETWEQGGRLSCSGTSFQSIHAYERLELQIVDNNTGERSPVVEYDYDNNHFVMAYKQAGVKPPRGDLYRIPGFDRKHCKAASVIGINAPTTSSGLLAVANEVGDERFLTRAQNRGGYFSPRHNGDTYTHRLVDAVSTKHRRIAHLFFGDWGVKFQREESEMALEVMELMIDRVGQPPLCVHDSFVVPEAHGPELAKVMKEVARRHGLDLKVSQKKRRPMVSSGDLSDDHPLRSVPPRPIQLPKTPFIDHTSTPIHTPPTSIPYRCGELCLYTQVEGSGPRHGQNTGNLLGTLWDRLKDRCLGARTADHGRDPPYG